MLWYGQNATEKTCVFGLNRPSGSIHNKDARFFSAAEILLRISNPHTFKWGTLRKKNSVGELHAASKTSSANGSHLNVWDLDISAAEFSQQKNISF